MTENTTKRPHHHGNLRNALITAGLELLESDGVDALTLRKCAALAGVSHAAPAHHFNGLISLKVAIITRGHILFTRSMCKYRDRAGSDPLARLNGICEGYIKFARTHTSLFRFMFHPHGEVPREIDETTRAEHEIAAKASYDVLRQACTPFVHPGDDPMNTESMIWSLVHGYAMLFVHGEDTQSPGGTVPDFSKILPNLQLRPE